MKKTSSSYHITGIGVSLLRRTRASLVGALTFGLLAAPLIAQGPRADSRSANNPPDYASVSREIQRVEAVINKTIMETFNGKPSVLTGMAKGAYLQGYGVAFSFTVNIYRGSFTTPFGVVQTDDLTPQQKLRRIEDLKEKLSRILLESGASLQQIRGDDTIAIVGFFDDRNFRDEQSQSKTVVLSVLKRELDEVSRKEDRWREFKQRMKTVEY